jgi:hypothetical protein
VKTHLALGVALILLSVCAPAAPRQRAEPAVTPQAIDIPESEVAGHRIGTRGPVYLSDAMYEVMTHDGVPPTRLDLVVSATGEVLSVDPGSRSMSFGEYLQIAAKTWTYAPFAVNGKAVVARIRESIPIQPLGKAPKTPRPFPQITDWNSLRITLIRTQCYGACPSYTVRISGDGTVRYEGESFVAAPGKQRGTISRQAIAEILEAFRRADYFSLGDGYISMSTDGPTFVTAISFDGNAKWILNYQGWDIGMPKGVSEVEAAIDRLSGAMQWVMPPPQK